MVTMPYSELCGGHLAEERCGELGAGAAERVAEGDGAAVDVELRGVDAEDLDDGEDWAAKASLSSKRSMSSSERPASLEGFGDGVDGADAHLFGVAAGVGEGDEAGQRGDAKLRRRARRT
jgi:hypothetical protein